MEISLRPGSISRKLMQRFPSHFTFWVVLSEPRLFKNTDEPPRAEETWRPIPCTANSLQKGNQERSIYSQPVRFREEEDGGRCFKNTYRKRCLGALNPSSAFMQGLIRKTEKPTKKKQRKSNEKEMARDEPTQKKSGYGRPPLPLRWDLWGKQQPYQLGSGQTRTLCQ